MRRGIVVEACMDPMGGIIVRPKSDRWAKIFRKCVVENGGPDEATTYFQGSGAEDFIQFDVPKHYRKDLLLGWTVRWIEDPWTIGHWYGWDAHTAVE